MALPVDLPRTFTNSFRTSPSPRRGLEVLEGKLAAGIRDSSSILYLFKARAAVHKQSAVSLLAAVPTEEQSYPDPGDTGASLGLALTALRQETTAQSNAHHHVATEIERNIIAPFEEWSAGHEERVKDGQKQINEFVSHWESASNQLNRARDAYMSKCAQADEADTEARLTEAPAQKSSPAIDTNVTAASAAKSPRALMSGVSEAEEDAAQNDADTSPPNGVGSTDSEAPQTRLGSVGMVKSASHGSKRVSIADRLKALTSPETTSQIKLPPEKVTADAKGKAKETEPVMPQLLEIGGVTNGVREWSGYFQQAKEQLPKRSYKLPLVGVYHDVHSGAELAAYFQENLVALEGSYERSLEFCRQLVEELHILRLLGEFGRRFHDSDDAMYTWDKDAFNLHRLHETMPSADASSPAGASPLKSEGLKRSSTVSYISSALDRASLYAKEATAVANERLSETRQQRLHRELESTERHYRETVDKAEKARLAMDQAIESHLPYMQRCEAERLKAASRAMLAFTATSNPIVRLLQAASEEAALVVNTVKPEQDLTATIELYRTGSYRPTPHVFLSHDGVQEGNFGIDLRRWQEIQSLKAEEARLPSILKAVLDHLKAAYPQLPSDEERRMVWIYEVPLPIVHRLRSRLNDSHAVVPVTSILEKADPPILAALVKLWLLELDPPVIPYVVYEDLKVLYVHQSTEADQGDGRSQELKVILERIPHLHLAVLDALLSHLQQLIADTKANELDEVYRNKLALTIGRTIARPKVDTAISLNDRAPVRFFVEMLERRESVLPEVLAKRSERESHRFDKPVRKRTAPTDMRTSRKSLGLPNDVTLDPKNVEAVLKRQLSPPPAPVAADRLVTTGPWPDRTRAEASTLTLPVRSPLSSSTRSASPEFVDAPSALPPSMISSPSKGSNGLMSPTSPEDPPFSPPRHQSLDEGSDPPFVPPIEDEQGSFEADSTDVSYSTPLRQSLRSLDNERVLPHSGSKTRFDQAKASYEYPPFTIPNASEDGPLNKDPADLSRDGSASALQRSIRVSRGPRPASGIVRGQR